MARAAVAFVLHAHLPDLRDATAEDSLEERWLFEALTDTYVPLADLLDDLARDALPVGFGLSLSPTLLAMLGDARLKDRYRRHLAALAQVADREVARRQHDPALGPLAARHKARFARTADRYFDVYGADLAAVFRSHAAAGRLELLTTGATHAILPLLRGSPVWVRTQIAIAITEHQRTFGEPPAGFWLPECAWDPALDVELRRAGIRWVVLDTHGIALATPAPVFGPWAPIASPEGVIAFGRDPETARQVWSREGFPGDRWYREYHRDLGYDEPASLDPFLSLPPGGGPTGIKYFRVTGGTGAKAIYEPDRAAARVAVHARQFVEGAAERAAALEVTMGRPPVFVCPYDAELFGHWWHEGMDWLGAVLRLLAEHPALEARTPSRELAANPTLQRARPAASTWGEAGHQAVWMADATSWIHLELSELGERVANLCRGSGPASDGVRSAAEHLLLAQSSDWPFMVSRNTAAAYGRHRLAVHLGACRRLCDTLERGVAPDPADLRPTPLFPTLDLRRLADASPLSQRRADGYNP